mmetsp:Transcript_23195/g.31766  ORF Transcript_23195/g.31766 Transcript_23195/m.31766 type:complete len:305 (-) Transcript_23195:295-1209(-)
MHQQRLELAVHHVLLHLGDVVGHVVHHVDVQVVRGLLEVLAQRLPHEEGHAGSIHPGVVGRRRHGRQVVLSLLRGDLGAGELPVVGDDPVPHHGGLHGGERVRGHLVPQPPGPAVDHHTHLAQSLDAHPAGGEPVVDLVHHLQLAVVVAGAQRAQLRQAPLLGPAAHLAGVGLQHAAELLAVLLVLGPGIALLQTPVDAHLQSGVQVGCGHWNHSFGAHAHWDVVEQGLGQLLPHRTYLFLCQICPQEAHSAINIETHATGTDYRLRIAHVECSNISYRKPVAGMEIWKSDGLLDYPGKSSNVG